MSFTATLFSFVSTSHFEGSRGGRLSSRRHAAQGRNGHSQSGTPYTTPVDVNGTGFTRSLLGTPWGEFIPDGIGACGVVVAAAAAWLSQRASSRPIDVSETVAAIEQDRRNTERVPQLSARLESWGTRQDGFVLSVWLESPEPLARIRVVVQEARNMDCPLGFKRGQNGVANELPPMLEAEGIRPAWQTDTLHPLAAWNERIASGTPALWLMQLRRTADLSSGADGVRFRAMARAERDDRRWELPLPVSITDNARALISGAAAQSGR